jgi:ABC-type antimicrobial peptide transport system permease subunit
MSLGRLLWRNLFYHWRGNVAVFFGVVVGAAVLTGALLVGDSLRGSLRDLTLQRLGWVDQALVAGRFFREGVADELKARRVSPVLLLQGSAESKTAGNVRRAGRITIYGVDDRFWGDEPPVSPGLWRSTEEAAVLSKSLAEELGVAVDGAITLHVQKVSFVPRDSPFASRPTDEVGQKLRLTVRGVDADESPGGRFSLNPGPAAPRNVFVPVRHLQDADVLNLPGQVNALLVGGGQNVQHDFQSALDLDDWGLVLHTPESRVKALFARLDRNKNRKLEPREWERRLPRSLALVVDPGQTIPGVAAALDPTLLAGVRFATLRPVLTYDKVLSFYKRERGYISLESRQMFLEPAVVEAAEKAARAAGLRTGPTLVYLANCISHGTESVPYSVVAALDPTLPAPLGPFLPPGEKLKPGQIILADWDEWPFHARVGDSVGLTYFEPIEQGQLQEKTTTFRVRARMRLRGVAADPDLTPTYPGITDKEDIRSWHPPFDYDNRLIKPRDERYWQNYRTTPKAYIALAQGHDLWQSRFGKLTSIRLAPTDGGDLENAAKVFHRELRANLDARKGGMVFDDVRERGLEASSNGTDFGLLFLAFSFFLIAAALLLVGLMFRLNLERRAAELGLLFAAGYRRAKVRWLLLAEGGLLAAIGGIVGLGGAIVYAWLMLQLLGTLWPGRLDVSFLHLHVTPLNCLIGYGATVIMSVGTIGWATRVLGKVPPRALLAGETAAAAETGERRLPLWAPWLLLAALVGALGCLVAGSLAEDAELQAGTFFGSGFLLLVACLTGLWTWMRGSRHHPVTQQGGTALVRLGVRNAARHPVRSLLTVGLLAAATFLVVAVQSFHRNPDNDFVSPTGGSGGYPLVAEADVPIYQDLNSPDGQKDLASQFRWARQEGRVTHEDGRLLSQIRFVGFRLRAGDDASCLNLAQPRRPRILGVPPALIRRGGFQFREVEGESGLEESNPWRLLQRPAPDGTIPVFGEANTVEWILKSKLGGRLTIPDERGELVPVRVVGLLKDSVFQSELLMSEENFLRLYPRQEGYQFFLLEVPEKEADRAKAVLEAVLADQGFYVQSAAKRLELYQAVENTYLFTFQILGAFGLLLGALGLAVVLLRSVWERRGELALLRALGYRRSALGWLVLAENSFLLVLGLGIGAVAALLAVAPHLVGTGGQLPLLELAGMLAVVLAVGLTAGAAAVVSTLRAPLLPALRRE